MTGWWITAGPRRPVAWRASAMWCSSTACRWRASASWSSTAGLRCDFGRLPADFTRRARLSTSPATVLSDDHREPPAPTPALAVGVRRSEPASVGSASPAVSYRSGRWWHPTGGFRQLLRAVRGRPARCRDSPRRRLLCRGCSAPGPPSGPSRSAVAGRRCRSAGDGRSGRQPAEPSRPAQTFLHGELHAGQLVLGRDSKSVVAVENFPGVYGDHRHLHPVAEDVGGEVGPLVVIRDGTSSEKGQVNTCPA